MIQSNSLGRAARFFPDRLAVGSTPRSTFPSSMRRSGAWPPRILSFAYGNLKHHLVTQALDRPDH